MAQPYYRSWPQPPSGPNARPPWETLLDDSEPPYIQASPSNRMLLALRSGIDSEIDWALSRLARYAHDKFLLKSIPGILEELFAWPEWFLDHSGEEHYTAFFFSPDPLETRKRRRALDSLLILRNTSLNETNAQQLASHPRTRSLVGKALNHPRRSHDSYTEFLLHTLDLLFSISSNLVVVPSGPNNPIKPLEEIALSSTNRALIISALQTLTLIMSNPQNAANLSPASPALTASLRYLPLYRDKVLLSASLEFLYAHLSNQLMTKAFLLHSGLNGTLRVLAALLIAEQEQETISIDIEDLQAEEPQDEPSGSQKYLELSAETLQELAARPEPERSQAWVRAMFRISPMSEIPQVDFWRLYESTFSSLASEHPMLNATEVIKNAAIAFPQAQPIARSTDPPKFVIRGIARRPMPQSAQNQIKCLWGHSTCPAQPFDDAQSLYSHVQNHIASMPTDTALCPWSTCKASVAANRLVVHIRTHLPSLGTRDAVPGQHEMTLPLTKSSTGVIKRRNPPASKMTFAYARPKQDAEPPSTSLAALLILRVLFRTAFVADDTITRADDDHFGFPGLIEEDDPGDSGGDDVPATTERVKRDLEGEGRGRAAFVGIRAMLSSVQFADPVLQDWVTEMADMTIGEIEVDEDVI